MCRVGANRSCAERSSEPIIEATRSGEHTRFGVFWAGFVRYLSNSAWRNKHIVSGGSQGCGRPGLFLQFPFSQALTTETELSPRHGPQALVADGAIATQAGAVRPVRDPHERGTNVSKYCRDATQALCREIPVNRQLDLIEQIRLDLHRKRIFQFRPGQQFCPFRFQGCLITDENCVFHKRRPLRRHFTRRNQSPNASTGNQVDFGGRRGMPAGA